MIVSSFERAIVPIARVPARELTKTQARAVIGRVGAAGKGKGRLPED